MTGAALWFTVVGVATVTSWLFKIIDAIEAAGAKWSNKKSAYYVRVA